MRKLSIAFVAITALVGTPVFAADMVVKAPPLRPAPPCVWCGFYAGLNAGSGWGNNNINFNGDPVFYGSAIAAGQIPPLLSSNAKGFVGGGQAGYNWQSGAVVYGIETDIQYAHITWTTSILNPARVVAPFFPGIGTTAQDKVDWIGTLRPRLGIAATPSFLLYATGGLAYGHIASSASTLVSAPITCAGNLFCSAGAASQTRAGWTAGAGVEYALAAPWSVKVEYLYVDLGRLSYNIPSTLVPSVGMQGTTAFRENIVRAGVNYKFQ